MADIGNLMLQFASFQQEGKTFFEEANWLSASLTTISPSKYPQTVNRINELTQKGIAAFHKSTTLQKELIKLQNEFAKEQKQNYLR